MFAVIYFFAHLGNQLELHLLGDDSTFLITPNNVIVGNLRSKRQQVCNAVEENDKECYPNKWWNFKKGDVIDFTWGMSLDQVGELVYSIVPAGYKFTS